MNLIKQQQTVLYLTELYNDFCLVSLTYLIIDYDLTSKLIYSVYFFSRLID